MNLDKHVLIDESLVINKDYFNLMRDDLLCSICLGLLNNPVMCAMCETPYCKFCINCWVKKSKICQELNIIRLLSH